MIRARLAPLCGVTDHVFRQICYEQGCELAYTEMISAMGYVCAPKQLATQELMIRGEHEPKLILQLFGREPSIVAEAAARMAELKRYDGFDLNMGCPAHKIAPSGEGCGLMRTPEIAFRMMKQTVQAVDVPVSVKMRLGWDAEHINAVEMAQLAEEAGIAEITVHGRTREQQYSGLADWEAIARVKQAVKIPVFGNGDISSGADALRLQKTYGVDGVMIGRGAMGNPWIFREVTQAAAGREVTPVSLQERFATIDRHYADMLAWKPVHLAVREMRKHIGWYLHGLRDAAKVRVAINKAENPDAARAILREYAERLAGEEQKDENILAEGAPLK